MASDARIGVIASRTSAADTAAAVHASYGKWLAGTLGLVVLLSALTAWANWQLDVLGLFRSHNVAIYSLDRYSTYALSYRYIPEHFDALLLGNSLTTNWDTSHIPGYRVFNCSIRGGNFSEEDLIAQNVLAHGHPKMIVLLVHPSFTSSHGRFTPYMTKDEYWSSLGSIQLLTIYAQMAAEKLAGPNTKRWTFQHRAFTFGGQNFRIPDRNGPADEPAREFYVDPIAEKEFVNLIETAHARGIKLYFLIPPAYRERWQINGAQVSAYNARMLAHAGANDTVINLNDGSLAAITSSHANFPDYTHLALPAAGQACDLLARRIAANER